jgi:stalled ribosome rescue protein Dom34
MKNVGIWVDKREAKIVSIEGDREHLVTVVSGIEEFHAKGGSRSRVKWGPQDVVQDSKYLEREKHQLASFFKEIIDQIAGADAIVIFGPAQTGGSLNKEITENHPRLKNKIAAVKKADTMTDNQLVAWVRDYYLS